jgi:hypothetical protein
VACWLIIAVGAGPWGSQLRFDRQAREQFFGTRQAQAVDRHLEVFRRFGQAAVGVTIGLADHAQGQGRAVLHQFGDVAQRAAVVADGAAHRS